MFKQKAVIIYGVNNRFAEQVVKLFYVRGYHVIALGKYTLDKITPSIRLRVEAGEITYWETTDYSKELLQLELQTCFYKSYSIKSIICFQSSMQKNKIVTEFLNNIKELIEAQGSIIEKIVTINQEVVQVLQIEDRTWIKRISHRDKRKYEIAYCILHDVMQNERGYINQMCYSIDYFLQLFWDKMKGIWQLKADNS